MGSDGSTGDETYAEMRKRRSSRRGKRMTANESRLRARAAGRKHGRLGTVLKVVIVVLAIAVCAIPIPLVNDAIGYVPLLTLVLVLIASFVYLQLLVRALSFSEESLAPSCERGSETDFVINFTNSSPLVFVRLEPHIYISDLFGEVSRSIVSSMVLGPHEKRDFKFSATFEHVGTYSAGLDCVIISDLFGLFTHTVENDSHHSVEVLPKLFDVARVDLTNVSVMESQKAFQPIVTDDMDYAGVREYQWGDPLKTIHWKLSARGSGTDYYTRLFETFSTPGLEIIFDTSADRYDNETLMYLFDGLIESALSLNEYAIEQGVDPKILYIDKHGAMAVVTIKSVQEFEALIADVPRINVGDGAAALERLRNEGSSLYGPDNIAFCTTHVTEEVVSTLVQIKMRKRNPLLFAVIPRTMDRRQTEEHLRPLRRLNSAGIVYYAVTSASELGAQIVTEPGGGAHA